MSKSRKIKPSIYLTDQSQGQLKELVTWIEDRVGEMEVEEEWLEENGEGTLLRSMRGLVSFLKEEHLEEDESEDESFEDDEEYEEADEELNFDE